MLNIISEFIRSLTETNPILWSFFVLAFVSALSVLLYALWELVLKLIVPDRTGRDDMKGS